jgi:MarR family transcriptional regulator, lower aerobic nicotinate degradation pathway regulator
MPQKPNNELNVVDGLVQLSFLIHGALERRAAEQELSIIQTRLLGVLRDRTPTMKELGRLLELDKSSISGLVDRAERRGLVNRIPSDADGRAVSVALTNSGRSLVSRVSAQFKQDVLSVLGYLPDKDRDLLSKAISRLLVLYTADRGIDLLDTSGYRPRDAAEGRPRRDPGFRRWAVRPGSADSLADLFYRPLSGQEISGFASILRSISVLQIPIRGQINDEEAPYEFALLRGANPPPIVIDVALSTPDEVFPTTATVAPAAMSEKLAEDFVRSR